jgi:hypothetical protein
MRDAVGASVVVGGRVAGGGVGTSLVLPGCDGETVTEWAGAAPQSCMGGVVVVSARGLIRHPRGTINKNHLQFLVLSL